MHYDRDFGYGRAGYGGALYGRGGYGRDFGPRRAGRFGGRTPYGREFGGPPHGGGAFHGYGMGYTGGALRSRGSWEAGQRFSGRGPREAFEFEWGDGYVGGRGYGGTNYDYEHGYRTGLRNAAQPTLLEGVRQRSPVRPEAPEGQATRGGYSWSEHERQDLAERDYAYLEPYGPSRYGYGPYHERLQRRRRDDDEIRTEVEDTLFYDTWVDADSIQVGVEEGIVTLEGTLPNYEEVRYATDDAWDVDGVRGVRTNLRVAEEATEDRLSRQDPFGADSVARENARQPDGRGKAEKGEKGSATVGTAESKKGGGQESTKRGGGAEGKAAAAKKASKGSE